MFASIAMTNRTIQGFAKQLTAACKKGGTKERASFEQNYLKTQLAFFGVTVPFLRKLAKSFQKDHPDLTHEQLTSLTDTLFDSGNHNLCQLAALLLANHKPLLAADDHKRIQTYVQAGHTWAIVDLLSTEALASLRERFAAVRRALPRWTRNKDFWVRRSALLAFLPALRSGEGDEDFATFAELATPLLQEQEFFIRKAIGWILREASKKRPELVIDYLDEHIDDLSGLTLREGSKRLAPGERNRLLERWQQREM